MLGTNRNIFQLIIPEEFSGKYFKIIEDDYPTKIIEIEKKEKSAKTKLWLYLIIGYGLIMSFLFLKYFDINRQNSSDKNFTYKWSIDNSELNLVNTETQMVHTIYMDKNYDLNYEKILTYSNGRKVSESIDSDENGIYEKVIFFDLTGNNAGESFDKNQDGLFETTVIVLENQEKVVFEDKNLNGLFETKK